MTRPTLLAFACLVSACGASASKGGDVSFPSSSSSSYSASGNSFASPSAPAPPSYEQVTAGLVLRPDLLCVTFAVHVYDPDPDKALSIAQSVANELSQQFKSASGGAGTLRMRGFAMSPAQYAQEKQQQKEASGFALTADGAFEMPLADNLDFWARSRLVSAMVAVSRRAIDAHSGSAAKLSFQTPTLRVADVEVHRPKLTKMWVERAKAFVDAAQAPLVLADCTAPGEIAQRHVSMEEVQLTLSIACRLDAPKPK